MATIDIFNNDCFSATSLAAAINKQPFQPTRMSQINLFMPNPVRTDAVWVEELNGVLKVIQTSPRGAPVDQRPADKRKARAFKTSRIAHGDRLMASELQGIRAFGSETELMQVQAEVARRMNGPTGIMRNVEMTWENMMLGAAQGVVTDADGSTLYNWFDEFGITQAAEINFDLSNAAPASGAVRTKCSQVVRQMMKASSGAWVPGQTGVRALCGDDFWDALTAHSEVRQTYLNTQEARNLREGVAYETFQYGGITWENYRGTDDGSTIAIPAAKAKFFPERSNGAFVAAWSPGESFDFVNTLGLPVYPMIVPDDDRNMFVDIEAYSYPLFICTRPGMLQRAKMA